MDPFSELNVDDLIDFDRLSVQQDLLDAMRSRASRNAGTGSARLALAMIDGLMRRIWMIEATFSSLRKLGALTDEKEAEACDGCRRQIARIEAALSAAAQAAGYADISAPATSGAIDAFLSHVDASWDAFTTQMFELAEAIDVGGDIKRFVLKDTQVSATISMKSALVSCLRHRRLRQTTLGGGVSPIGLEALVNREIAKDRHEVGTGRQISLRSDIGAAHIVGYPAHSQFAVSELIDNALLFSDREAEVRVSLVREGRHVSLFVDDDGPGFQSPDPRESLLPFTRATETPNGDMASHCRLGLGLANIELVARHSGWSLDFAKGKRGLRPVLLFPLS